MSAYIIEDNQYIKLAGLFYSILQQSNHHSYSRIAHPITVLARQLGFDSYEHQKIANKIVEIMHNINVKSVDWRYTEENSNELELPEKPNQFVLELFNPDNVFCIINFLDSWDYQSCEIPRDVLTEQEQLVYNFIPEFQLQIAMSIIKMHAKNTQGGWCQLTDLKGQNIRVMSAPRK